VSSPLSSRPTARARAWLVIAPVAVVSSAASVAVLAASQRARRDARHRRFDLELDTATAEVRERLRIARARARRHDLVNAFTAVEGAATILARESIRPSDRTTLTDVLESGLTRVRALLASEFAPDQAPISLGDAAALVAKQPPWDTLVDLQVPSDLVGAGSPAETEEAIRQVLAYAHWRAPTSALTIRGQHDGETAVLWVEDQGPQLSARQRRAFLEPDRRLARSETVTTLHIAIRLTREQGGDFRIADRPGGGASFGICMPIPGA
jgi:signal transduction histidine kinase